jgi:hypothetical protein
MGLGKFPHPQLDMGIPAVSYCYNGDGSGESIPDGDLPIAILSQDAPWAHSSRPCHTPFSTSMHTRVGPGPNHVTSFAVEKYFIRPAKCEARVQHDKRVEQQSVLNQHRRKTNSTPEPYLVASNISVRSLIIHQHMVNFRISCFS